jgi:AcrR family transcriptional regulator
VQQSENAPPCKRPYDLGRRQEASNRSREVILRAAQTQLESGGVRDFTMESLARSSGVTRQTIHNLFGTKPALLEALFDRMAADAGLMRMREVMSAPDGESMLAAMVEVLSGFWKKDRSLLKRIHGLAAIDSEFGRALEARNQRRQGVAKRVIDRLYGDRLAGRPEERTQKIAVLVALTSFEFFDALVQSLGSADHACAALYPLVRRAVAPE